MDFFTKSINKQEERHAENQNNIINLLSHISEIQFNQSETEPNLGAPRRSSDSEFLIESLSNSITKFEFDSDSNSTFENWFNRYRDLFEEDAKQHWQS